MKEPLPRGRSRSASDISDLEESYDGAEAVIPAGHEIESVMQLESETEAGDGTRMRWLRIVYRPAMMG